MDEIRNIDSYKIICEDQTAGQALPPVIIDDPMADSYTYLDLAVCHWFNMKVIAQDVCGNEMESNIITGIVGRIKPPKNVHVWIDDIGTAFIQWDADPVWSRYRLYTGDDLSSMTLVTEVTRPEVQMPSSPDLYFALCTVDDSGIEGCKTDLYPLISGTPCVPEDLTDIRLAHLNQDNIWDAVGMASDNFLKIYFGLPDGAYYPAGGIEVFSDVKDYIVAEVTERRLSDIVLITTTQLVLVTVDAEDGVWY